MQQLQAFGHDLGVQGRDARDVAARPVQARDKPYRNRIGTEEAVSTSKVRSLSITGRSENVPLPPSFDVVDGARSRH